MTNYCIASGLFDYSSYCSAGLMILGACTVVCIATRCPNFMASTMRGFNFMTRGRSAAAGRAPAGHVEDPGGIQVVFSASENTTSDRIDSDANGMIS